MTEPLCFSIGYESEGDKMLETESVYLIKEGPIASIFLNRPSKLNAINYDIWSTLPELLYEVEKDSSIKGLVLRGVKSEAFSVGADIREFKDVRSSPERSRLYDEAIYNANKCLENLTKPTVALIQGYCIGGGAGLALACDFRFSDDTGRFGITPSKIGLVYSTSATKRLVDLVGPSKAKDLLMSGRMFGANEAYQIGLIDRLYETSNLVEKTYDYLSLLSERSQLTVRSTKKIVQEILNGNSENSDEINKLIEKAYESEDYKEGVQAFIEKRKPKFK